MAALVLLSGAGFLVAVPFARMPLPRVPAFIPIYESALAVIDLVTATMLFGQFAVLRTTAVLVLAGGYAFSMLMTIAHALTFPGLFAPRGLLGAGAQSTAWLYMFWHGGFALAVIAYALLREREIDRTRRRTPQASVFACLAVVSVLVAGLTALATTGETMLPAIMRDDRYTGAMIIVVSAVWLLNPLAIAAISARRPLTIIDVWLIAVLFAWLFDIGLSAVFNAGRFDIGFYTGRVYGLLATSVLLGIMLIENGRHYARLATAAAGLSGRVGDLEADARAQTTRLERANAALTQEISERERAEQQLVQAQKMEAIGNLTGGMAHDFNNILAVVIGNLELLSELGKGDPDLDELVGEARDAALRGAELTRRLLAFARRQPLQPERIDVNGLIVEATRMLARVLGEDVEVMLELTAEPCAVTVDPVQLEASLTNLANNARDAMPRGGKLTFATRRRRLDEDYAAEHPEVVPGEYVVIEVSDTGSGMTQAVASRIFEPFYTTKPTGQGTGLGLSMVFGFIKQSQGHINVYSEPGVGTIFRLYLPCMPASDPASAEQRPPEAEPGDGETVLAVEDSPALRRVLVRQLQELGYRVLQAENAAAALDLLGRQPVDVLLTDVVMAGSLNGVELARTVRERWPQVKAVLTSGFPGTSPAGERPPAELRLLCKPYKKEELARALRAVLGGGSASVSTPEDAGGSPWPRSW